MKTIEAHQWNLDGELVTLREYRWLPGEFAALREQVEIVHCEVCELPMSKRKAGAVLYDDPWQEPGNGAYMDYLCRDCRDTGAIYSWSEFGPDYCPRGEHDVIQRDPSNGWRSYFTSDPEDPEDVCCVGCAQRFLLEFGHTTEQALKLSGICDFYTLYDLREHGWAEFKTIEGDSRLPNRWRHTVLHLLDHGYRAITDQGPTGLGNAYPDWVTVYRKAV